MAGNKKLSQHDLRKAMHELKKKTGAVKRIESPLAKYTESGQLMCIVCKTNIRSETVWPVHLNSKGHKENLVLTKKSLDNKDSGKKSEVSALKRLAPPTTEVEPAKKIKSILKNPGHSQTSTLPDDFFDRTTTNGKTVVASVARPPERSPFIDNKTKESSPSIVESDDVKDAESGAAAALPEGFFDDPILDAKVRNVEYRDPIEEEWDKFQKEIKEETAQSEQLIAEDHEEAITVRHTDEIDEQMNCFSRVLKLVRAKEKLPSKPNKVELIDDDSTSGDEGDYDEFLDWRSKNSYQ